MAKQLLGLLMDFDWLVYYVECPYVSTTKYNNNTEGVIFVIGDALQYIGHCLIPVDPWIILVLIAERRPIHPGKERISLTRNFTIQIILPYLHNKINQQFHKSRWFFKSEAFLLFMSNVHPFVTNSSFRHVRVVLSITNPVWWFL